MYWKGKTVIVTGGSGFLGSHLCDLLREGGCEPLVVRSSRCDLRRPNELAEWMINHTNQKVDCLFNLAANVGGIGYNRQHPYTILWDNIRMGSNVIDHSLRMGVKKLVQMGTVCAYPKHTRPPFRESQLWDGYPEETNAPYGLAKKLLLVQLQAAREEFGFNGIYLLPTNLYGPRDEFDPVRSHVIPALIRKCIKAREAGRNIVEAWGSGEATRDFLYVEDAARGILAAAERYDSCEPLNLGSGGETKISVLLHFIMKLVGFKGAVRWDRNRPDGQPRRVLDIQEAMSLLDWVPQVELQDGLSRTIEWYEEAQRSGQLYNEAALRGAVHV